MRSILRISVLVVLCTWPIRAIYAPVDLQQIPVARLVANLEGTARERPKDVWTRINVGRAHAMAYAQKTETLTAAKLRGSSEMYPWFKDDSLYIPFTLKPAEDPATRAGAMKHLQIAIGHFRRAIEMAPNDIIPRISLGWCLEQSGDKAAAILSYRDAIARGWPSDGSVIYDGLGSTFVAAEAAGYLIPLLDPKKDAPEIDMLRQRRAKTSTMMRPVTPIAVPLSDDLRLADVVDADAVVTFDADGTGHPKSWTWITPEAAWLVYDQVGQSEINSALQLFGSVSFWMFWDTGYDAMRALDDNRDGCLAGTEQRHLGLWRDANSNGISDRGEVQSLAAYDIVSLSYDFVRVNDADRTPFVAHGVTFRDGRTRPTWDVVLQPAR